MDVAVGRHAVVEATDTGLRLCSPRRLDPTEKHLAVAVAGRLVGLDGDVGVLRPDGLWRATLGR